MPQIGWTIGKQRYTFEEATEASRNGTLEVPIPLLRALRDNREDTTPSASVLGGCIRQFQLKRDFDYYDSLEGSMARGWGTAIHSWLAKYDDAGTKTEQRLAVTFSFPDLPAPYDKVELSGTPDNIDDVGITFVYDATQVRDWKSKIYVPRKDFYPDKTHRTQVNIYHYMHVANGGKPLQQWEIVYMDNKSVPRTFRGPLADYRKVGTWLEEILHDWAESEANGGIMPPIKTFYKQLNPESEVPTFLDSPCKYCPVALQCLSLWREGKDTESYQPEEDI